MANPVSCIVIRPLIKYEIYESCPVFGLSDLKEKQSFRMQKPFSLFKVPYFCEAR
jgi:hypothetical protein